MFSKMIFVPLLCYVIATSGNNTFRLITNIQGVPLCCVANSSTIIQSYTVTSCQPECAHLCWKNPNCNGFNYAKKLSSSNCQLYLSFSGMFEESSNSNYECQFFSRTSFDAPTAPSIFLTEQPTRIVSNPVVATVKNIGPVKIASTTTKFTALESFNCLDKNPCGRFSHQVYPYATPDKYISCLLSTCKLLTCAPGTYFDPIAKTCR